MNNQFPSFCVYHTPAARRNSCQIGIPARRQSARKAAHHHYSGGGHSRETARAGGGLGPSKPERARAISGPVRPATRATAGSFKRCAGSTRNLSAAPVYTAAASTRLAEDNCTVRFANFHRHDAIILLSSGERRLGMLPGLFLCIEGRHFNYALLAVPNHCVNHCYNAPSPPNAKLCALSLGRSIAGRCQLDPFRSGGDWD